MKQFLDLLASVINRDPIPGARPTPLITSTTPPGGGFSLSKGAPNMTRMTRESLKQIIEQVEADPLAGMGSLSKKELLIDRLLAHWNTVEARPAEQPTAPKQLITEPAKPLVLDRSAPSVSTVKQSIPGQTTIVKPPEQKVG